MTTSEPERKNATQLTRILATGVSRNLLLPSDFLQMVIQRTGGPEKFAGIVAGILTDPKVAGVAKQRIISDMTRMMQHVETKSRPQADLSTYSTEDLRTLMGDIVSEMEKPSVGPPADTERDGRPAAVVEEAAEGRTPEVEHPA